LDQTGPNRIEFGIENNVLDSFSVEQFGVLEAISPEGTSTTIAVIEPLGELPVDVLHEAGNIEQIAVELFPMGLLPVMGLQSPESPEAESGPVLEFVKWKPAVGLKENDRVKVIPHQFEGGETAEVEFEVAFKQAEKLAGNDPFPKGEVPGISGNAVEEVIKGGF
jgi:hypothetical protein